MKPAELYVYYKLQAFDAPAARAAFDAARGTVGIRLLQREDEGQLLTWMEIYTADQALLEPVVAAALQRFVQGVRHVEAFAPLN